ncbi:hypothetical protein RFI_39695 [Reticulomyxa filosa]|uniref:Uncharacterized protein n=1 Tax=Reticulomyxa filosa TaxID=46433 RepID=X6L9M3_RETFI|nr:hypothetical protein RFI_39695 [Reticulomyxa filosa]|eukprot:ETN97831.1 hypothetical protein RFI_39695 [Reticulomyxa filosa]
MILEEAEADADGNEDNEYSDQANEQEDPLNNPNLLPWAKEEAFVEQVYMQQQQMQQQKFESEKHYRFHPRGKTIRFTVTYFQADLTIPKIILVHEK